MTRYAHGTYNCYNHDRCRCDPCKAAGVVQRNSTRVRALTLPPPTGAHGTTDGFRHYGCRCGPCGKANADACRDYRERKKGER